MGEETGDILARGSQVVKQYYKESRVLNQRRFLIEVLPTNAKQDVEGRGGAKVMERRIRIVSGDRRQKKLSSD